MDEFVRKAAGLGLPVILLLIVMATTGFAGSGRNYDGFGNVKVGQQECSVALLCWASSV